MQYIADIEKTKKIAVQLANSAKLGDCFCLRGDLGAGKTEFARFFIQTLSGKDTIVSSPTYNILQIYNDNIAHFDLYRIENSEELEEIGFSDYLDKHICLIEWPENADDSLPSQFYNIEFEMIDDNNRKITITNIDE